MPTVGPIKAARNIFTQPIVPPEAVEALPGWLQPVGREVREMTSPTMLAATALTAGVGPAVARGLGGVALSEAQKKVIATLMPGALTAAKLGRGAVTGALTPVVRGGFAQRMAAEQALGVVGGMGARAAVERVPETAPTWAKVAAGLAGGLVGGGLAVGGIRGLERGIPRAAEAVTPTLQRLATEQGGFARLGGGLTPAQEGESALLFRLTTASQAASTETKLAAEFGMEVLAKAHTEGLVTRSPKGVYSITLKGKDALRELNNLATATVTKPVAPVAEAVRPTRGGVEAIRQKGLSGEQMGQALKIAEADFEALGRSPGLERQLQDYAKQANSEQRDALGRVAHRVLLGPTGAEEEALRLASRTPKQRAQAANRLLQRRIRTYEGIRQGRTSGSRLSELEELRAFADTEGLSLPATLDVEMQVLRRLHGPPSPAEAVGGVVRKEAVEDIATAQPPAAQAAGEAAPAPAPRVRRTPPPQGAPGAAPMEAAGAPPSPAAAPPFERPGPGVLMRKELAAPREPLALGPSKMLARRDVAMERWARPMGAATDPELVSVRASGGNPPGQPPIDIPPDFPIEAVPDGSTDAIERAMAVARAIVTRDRARTLTRVLDFLPGLKQGAQALQPARGMSDQLLTSWVAEGNVQGVTATRLARVRIPVLERLEQVFGEDVVRGRVKSQVRFLGTVAEARYPATGTMYDIAQNPQLYDLSPVERAAIAEGQEQLSRVFNDVRAAYQVDIGEFPVRPGGMFLSNIETPEKGLGIFQRAYTAKSGRAKTRFYETGRERWQHDMERGIEKPFAPIVNVVELLGDEMHGSLVQMAGRSVYKRGIGGLNRMEALQATGHEALVKKMVGLRSRLQGLRAAKGRLTEKQQKAIDAFLESPIEDADMAALREELEPVIARGRDVGKDVAALDQEVQQVRAQIGGLQPAWKSANAKGYQFVQEGIYRYFPDEEAAQLRRLAQVSNNSILRLVDNLRATAFGGDLSPVTIQGSVAWLADPTGVSRAITRGVKADAPTGKLLGGFTEEALRADMERNAQTWGRFIEATGLNPLGGVEREFSVGLVGKVPGIGKQWIQFNESVYRPIMRLTKDIFDSSYEGARRLGYSDEQAMAVAADDALKMIPRISPRRLGMSQAEAARWRAVLTSVSFLTQPTALMADATKGLVKIGLKQTITPSEAFAVRRVSTFITTAEAIAVISSVAYAQAHGEDPVQAAREALDPTHANFMSIRLPWGARVGIGGPFRSLIRAVVPRQVPGVPVPLPFAGLHRFALSKLGPVLRIAYDEIRNVDFYGRRIRTGDFPMNILQGLEYALSGVAPLSLGTSWRTMRGGEGVGRTSEEALSQFAGTNYIPFDPIWDAKVRWDKDFTDYDAIPTATAKLKPGQVSRSEYLRRHPEVDAKLFITGRVSSLSTAQAVSEAARLIREGRIDSETISGIQKRKETLAGAQRPMEQNNVDALIAMLEGSSRQGPSRSRVPTRPRRPRRPRSPRPVATPVGAR